MSEVGPELSVVVPAFNEDRRIARTLQSLLDYLDERRLTAEIIVVDDGSRDRTAAVVREIGDSRVLLCSLPANRGKGEAVRQGVLRSRGKFVFLVDADLPYSLDFLDRALDRLRDDQCDAVIGARDLPGAESDPAYPRLRMAAGHTFAILVNALLPLGIADTQCGFKGFRGTRLRKAIAYTTEETYTLDIELLLIFKVWGTRIERLPVRLLNHDGSKVRLVRDSARMFWSLLKIARFYRLKHYPARPPDDKLIAVACPACGHSATRPLLTAEDLRFGSCKRCGSAYQNPRPSDDRLSGLYGESYFRTGRFDSGYSDYYATLEEQKKTARWLWDRIDEVVPAGKGNVLDVGCGSGELLREGRRRGREGWGLDPVEPRDTDGFQYIAGEFPHAGLARGDFELILFNDSFEHFPDPRRTLSEAAQLLSPNGYLILNTPDPGSWIARLSGSGWVSLKREHLILVSCRALAGMLAEAELNQVRRIASRQVVSYEYLLPRLSKASRWAALLLQVLRPLLPARLAVPTSGVVIIAARQANARGAL